MEQVYEAIMDVDEHFENALREMNLDLKSLHKRNFTKVYIYINSVITILLWNCTLVVALILYILHYKF